MKTTLGKWTTRRDGRTFGIYRNGILIEGGFFDGALAYDALIVHRNEEAATLAASPVLDCARCTSPYHDVRDCPQTREA